MASAMVRKMSPPSDIVYHLPMTTWTEVAVAVYRLREEKYLCSVCHKFWCNLNQHRRRAHDIMQKPTARIVCQFCDKTFTTQHQLTTHRVGPGACKLYCKHCKIRFSSNQSRLYHQEHAHNSNGGGGLQCSICEVPLAIQRALTRHMQSSHGITKAHACSICHKRFRTPDLCGNHVRIHTGERPHICTLCSRAYKTSSALYIHSKTHSDQRPHACLACGRRFARAVQLRIHARCHDPQRKMFECSYCNKLMTTNGGLLVHVRKHTGERPHMCSICKTKSFSTAGGLSHHMLSHTGERPHKCAQCQKTFRGKKCLRGHERTHSGAKPFPCPMCGKCFARANDVHAHLRSHNGERPFKCGKCGRCYATAANLRKHSCRP